MSRREDERNHAVPPGQLVSALFGVLIRPARTLRDAAAAQRWQWGVGIVAAYFLAEVVLLAWFATDSNVSRALLLLIGVAIYVPLDILLFAAVTYVAVIIGVRLGGTSNFTGLVAARGLGWVILFFMLPVAGIALRIGDALAEETGQLLNGILLLIAIWAYIVEVIAIREAIQISVGKAILTTILSALCALVLGVFIDGLFGELFSPPAGTFF